MVSAAKGAEDFYSIEHHASRKEGIEEAKFRDTAAAKVSNFKFLVLKVGIFTRKTAKWGNFQIKRSV